MTVRYGFFAAEKDDDAALESRVEAMCREIASRGKIDESIPVLPEGVPKELPAPSPSPSPSSALTPSIVQTDAVAPTQAPAAVSAATAEVTRPGSTLPSSASSALLASSPGDFVAMMGAIQTLLHAEVDHAQAQAEAQRHATERQRVAARLQALEVPASTYGVLVS